MSSGTSFAFDPLPATQSASGPPLSPQLSRWIMGNCNAYVLKKKKNRLTASHSRSNHTMVRAGEQKYKKRKDGGGKKKKVEQVFDVRLDIERGAGTHGCLGIGKQRGKCQRALWICLRV